jgi:hypothetical protein
MTTDWARLMYHVCLDYWPRVADLLSRFPLVGPFKKVGNPADFGASAWHYSGTFFWLRLTDALAHDRWRRIDRIPFGTEAWPGLHWPPHDAGDLFMQGTLAMNLYDRGYWNQTVLPEFERWKSQHARHRSATGSLTG